MPVDNPATIPRDARILRVAPCERVIIINKHLVPTTTLSKRERDILSAYQGRKVLRAEAINKLGYLRKNGELDHNRFYRTFHDFITSQSR